MRGIGLGLGLVLRVALTIAGIPPSTGSALLSESGSRLQAETGDILIIE